MPGDVPMALALEALHWWPPAFSHGVDLHWLTCIVLGGLVLSPLISCPLYGDQLQQVVPQPVEGLTVAPGYLALDNGGGQAVDEGTVFKDLLNAISSPA